LFRSIKAKMLALVIGILLVVALVVMVLTERGTVKEVLALEHKSIRNVLYLMTLNIENQYKNLLSHQLYVLKEQRKSMQDLSASVLAGFQRFRRWEEEGALTDREARQGALEWIKELQYQGGYCFVTNLEGDILVHGNSGFREGNIAHLRDMKGMPILRPPSYAAEVSGKWFSVFDWDWDETSDKFRQMGYFVKAPHWGWIVALVIRVEDLEKARSEKLRSLVEELRETFDKISVARQGYLILFDGKGEIIIHPGKDDARLAGASFPSPTDNVLEHLMGAADTGAPAEFTLEKEGREELYESYVTYFKTLDWYIASVAEKAEIKMPAYRVAVKQLLSIALIFAVGIVATYFLVARISRPLKDLARCARELPDQDFTVPESSLRRIADFPRRYRDEVGGLADSFLFMEKALKQYLDDLQRTTAAKEKIESELRIAHDIQMSILPKTFPPFPKRKDLDLYATLTPAKEVGGDFYDFFFVDEDRLFFVIGDVAGKGVPASLFMAITRTLFKAGVKQDRPPEEVLARVNDMLAEDNDACVFVTVFCGFLNLRTGEVVYANGGHNPPFVLRSEEVVCLAPEVNMALGIMEGMAFRSGRLELRPGDALFLYTDGVTEAMDGSDELFSEERLEEALSRSSGRSAVESSRIVVDAVSDFVGATPPSDDLTIMTLRFLGPSTPSA